MGTRHCIAVVALSGSLAEAVVIRHDRSDQLYLDRALEPRYAGVGQMRTAGLGLRGTGTLITDRWVLTAAHVADDAASWSFGLDGVSHAVDQVVIHPGWTGDPNDSFDVALMRLASPLAGATTLPVATATPSLGTPIDLVGFGFTGDGINGIQGDGGQRLRAGTNTVEWDLTGIGLGYIGFYFDGPGSGFETDLESMGAFNDSGGPVVAQTSGGWEIVGVTSFIQESLNGSGDAILGNYDDVHGAANIALYSGWIQATIPSPAAVWLIAFATPLAAHRRRRHPTLR